MDGTVTSFLADKGYGFVRGDDGRDYFLHLSDVAQKVPVVEGQRVSFETSATPRGYRARKARPVPLDGDTRYVLADGVTLSRENAVRGWDVLVTSRWRIHGSARGAPDDARSELHRHARMIGANAVLCLSYYATEGSEPGRGSGTHRFTIHNFKGYPVILGRASAQGTHARGDIDSIDDRAMALKTELVEETARSRNTATGVAIAIVLLGMVIAGAIAASMPEGAWIVMLFPLFFAAILSVVAWQFIAKDHDSWLECVRNGEAGQEG